MSKRVSPKWKEEELVILFTTLIDMREGHVAHVGRVIETLINRSRMSVAAKIQQLRLNTSDLNERQDDEGRIIVSFRPWSEFEDETLQAMHRRRYSLREMCVQLDRCAAVIDIRLGQMGMDPEAIDRREVPYRYAQFGLPPQEKKREEREKRVLPVKRLPPQVWKRRARRALAKAGGGCLYAETDATQIGHRMCGKPRRLGSPYCDHHHKLCWRVEPPNVRLQPEV